MALLDHLGITVGDLARGRTQFDPILTALGYERGGEDDHSVSWHADEDSEPHRHGRIGWQHMAFAVPSRADVDRLHDLAVEAGWNAIRGPKEYPRYSARYYASFVEDADGIRIEFMHNPPKDA